VTTPTDFFVSYARDDAAYVTDLVHHLRRHGLPVWYDLSMRWGSTFTGEIRRRLQHTLGVIVVMSPAAEASTWVEREILEGQRHDRDFLPILRHGERLFLLASSNYFDARAGALPGDREVAQLRAVHDAYRGGKAPAHLDPPPALPMPLPANRITSVAAAELGKLQAFLAAGEVEYADILTTSLLLEAVQRLDSGWLRRADGERLPAELLAGIDRAWSDISAGRYGFRAQLAHRVSLDGPTFRQFTALALALGWKAAQTDVFPRYGEFVGRTTHPPAFFPTLRNPQLELHHIWHDQWQETVVAIHHRLHSWGGIVR
jgi:hypothetical protein